MIDPEFGFWWLIHCSDVEFPIGFAGLHPSLGEYNAGYLVRAGVIPGHRGKGLQMRLIRVRERKARKLGWEVLRSDTTGSPASSNNLIKAGYRVFEPEVPWAFNNSIYWRKELV